MSAGPGRAATRIPFALLRHELRLLVSIAHWTTRRTHPSGEGCAYGYARGEGALLFGLAFVCVVEAAGAAVLLREWPVAHGIALVLDVYTVLMVVGLHAASVTRPHVLTPTALRLRRAAHVDLTVPLEHIVAVRRELRTTHEPREGELDIPVAAQTTVTLELNTPIIHVSLLGRPKEVHLIRFHAQEPDRLVVALRRQHPPPRDPAPRDPAPPDAAPTDPRAPWPCDPVTL
ncbi:hypothetical protein [Streptomyces sp. NPDC093984]|uniref:hypothetical protein n=1 Tax=Streptomyces sp. NPDC093984 TaxID=3366052 RepID=UPI0037F82B41